MTILAMIIKQAVAAHKEGRNKEAEQLYRSILENEPTNSIARNNLGVLLYNLGKFDQAEINIKKAIELRPNYAKAYNNLGNILQALNRLNEAEESFKKAIELEPDYAEAFNNLGVMLNDLGRLDEAEVSYNKAIDLKPDYAEAENNLALLLRENEILVNFFDAKKPYNNNKIKKTYSQTGLISNPFISKREIEKNLVSNLYKIKLKELDKVKGPNTKGPLFGNGKTTDFRLFENNQSILKNIENDLSKIMKKSVRSEVYIYESFLNIFNCGSGSIPHTHITNFDKTNNLINQKFSLQYYLDIGDQTCSEPGIFKLNNPDEEILPSNGMVMIIPAHRHHSAIYNGKVDRVMIGVNFYSFF